ncbi:hypothetical protein VP03_18500 [Sinorhizobium meliloti]|nr:hypothetical protein VP03_18500 [Sinorhizobium meliloti]
MSRRIIRGNDVEIATGAFDGRAHPSVLLVMRAPMPWWPERFCSRIPDKTAMAELVGTVRNSVRWAGFIS